MRKFVIAAWILMSATLLMAGGNIYPKSSRGSCQKVIVLYAAAYLDDRYDKSIECNYAPGTRINIWNKPSRSGEEGKVGELYPWSHAKVLQTSGDYYRIVSPLDNSIGWIHKKQTICMNSLNTKLSCSDHLDTQHKQLRKMDYYMETRSKGLGGLYLAAKRAKRSTIGVIRSCDFSTDLIAEYACSLSFYDKIMHDEMKKYGY